MAAEGAMVTIEMEALPALKTSSIEKGGKVEKRAVLPVRFVPMTGSRGAGEKR